MTWKRRHVLRSVGAAVGVATGMAIVSRARAGVAMAAAGGVSDAANANANANANAKRLSLSNVHTAEHLDLEFERGGAYVAESLTAIQVLLRDYRNGEQHPIDPELLDYLYDVAIRIGADPVYSVISGYRSPQTNEQLRARSEGVARHSLHIEGRAIDVRLAGVDCADLAARARAVSRGGVGYYRRSDFVHLDTGAVRTWNG